MRSSVSYMLSHGSGESAMSHPDYDQQAHHHSCLLVLIRGIGPSKPRSLQKIFERIQDVNNIKIEDSTGQKRDIWVRYIQDHPVENNDWGDFQTHRKLLGLITVGKFDSQSELNELCRVHESLKVKYNNTLFDSRCVLFGSKSGKGNKASPAGPPTVENSQLITDIDAEAMKSCQALDSNRIGSENNENAPPTIKVAGTNGTSPEDEFTTPSHFKSTAFFYPENDKCVNLEKNVTEFINSLFWILESKRLERSREKIEKVSLLLAPFEKKDFVGLDLDTRNMRKRCVGRVTKHLADLTLQAGLVAESLSLYHAASETLRAISDSLWLGAANEGLCAASAILLYPHIRYTDTMTSLQRNASLQENSTRVHAVRTASQESLSKAGLNSKAGLVINLKSPSKNGVTSTVSSSLSSTPASTSSSTSSVSSMISSSSSTSPPSTGTINQDKLAPTSLAPPQNILQPADIATRYRDAIINYSKYRHAGIVETEAALKASRICIEQNQNLDVAMFLQNVLYINLNMTEQERVKRFEILTDLYQKIGYARKAAFCQRLAAWRHVAQSNTSPDWSQSYRLMLDSFPGHKLSLDPLEVLDHNAGWPCLQIDLLQQLVVAARRLGHSALATRHMTFLLQTMWKHLSPSEQREMALQLQNLSAQCEGAPVPLVLEDGTLIPPSNLTDLPYCQQFQLKDLVSHLRPQKVIVNKVDSGPFLFTPIHFCSIDRRAKKNDGKIAFQWVQNDLCEVALKLKNPLPFELKLSDMRLLTNGVVFESLPQTVVLPPNAPTVVTLHGTPIEHGSLEVQGYSTHTLGAKSNCRLKHMTDRASIFPLHFTIEVIPSLPKLDLSTSFPQTASFSGLANADNVLTSASVTLFNGESVECVVTLTNTSAIPIEYIEPSIISTLDIKQQSRIFEWSNEELQAQLPIKPNESINLKMIIFGDADFLGPISSAMLAVGGHAGGFTSLSSSHHQANGHHNDGMNSLSGGMSALSVSGHTSLPSRMSSPINTLRRNELTSSFRSTQSGHSSLATLSLTASGVNCAPRQVEAQFRFRYSGGDGFSEGYCRQCAVSFNLELVPSAQVTSWDVLPAEIPSQFYLVLDVVNLTAQEMLLNYTTNKNIVIEAKESCRVPVPVERCPLEKLLDEIESIDESPDSNPYIIRTEAEKTERICSEHISDQVDLKWKLLGTDTTGITSLNGISLSSTMLSLITVAPLEWEILINDKPLPSQTEISCSAGQSIVVGVRICNVSPMDLNHITLTIQFYQDYQNGVCNYKLETRVTTSGPDKILIKMLKRNETAFHECSAIFFTAGRYKADIQCSTEKRTASTGVATQLHAFSGVNSSETEIWKFIPAPEITVVE